MLESKVPNIEIREKNFTGGRKCIIPPLNHHRSWISKLREVSLYVRCPILFNLLSRSIREIKDVFKNASG